MDFVAQVEKIEKAGEIPAFLKKVFITGKSKSKIRARQLKFVKTYDRAFLLHVGYRVGTGSLFQKIR